MEAVLAEAVLEGIIENVYELYELYCGREEALAAFARCEITSQHRCQHTAYYATPSGAVPQHVEECTQRILWARGYSWLFPMLCDKEGHVMPTLCMDLFVSRPPQACRDRAYP